MEAPTRERLYSETLLPALEAEDQLFLLRTADELGLEFDEIQQLVEAARDLEMWRETPLATLWREWEADATAEAEDRKRALLEKLASHLDNLRSQATVYPIDPLRGLTHGKAELVPRPAPTKVFTLCPNYSEEANCCGLHTIESASGCALACSFCSVGAYRGDRVEFSTDLAERLAQVEIAPERFYHISTGELSDSLMWGNRHGILDALFDFARRHPNVQLELKSKSDRIDYLRRHEVPSNILCTWRLNTETIIRNEEHGTATLKGRLQAARKMADDGCRIGFHINPVTHYQGWREDYTSLIGQLMVRFSPEEIDYVSLGAPAFTRPVVREIRRRGGESKALQMTLVEDPKGTLTYPRELRIELYSTLYRALQPWHERVFVFLCMETASTHEAVFGQSTPVAEELERLFERRR